LIKTRRKANIGWLEKPELHNYPAARSYLTLLKILAGKKLSPLLLVRSSKTSRLIVADGYHRLCAAYGFDEDALIPCKIT
jgi:hypothetical protein